MTIYDIINTLFLGPLKAVFELIFSTTYKVIGDPGSCIVFLSLSMNVLVLPLYRRADAIQTEVRNKENKLKDTVKHIKKTFTGNERMMILQTYYRQNQYSSFAALKSSLSLLLQIPFFMAAYQFLSNLDLLQGVSFGAINDLSKPDGLLTLGTLSINVLPFIMTMVNMASGLFYTKDLPLKSKIQLYGMAVVFLILLYNSPSALVLYWTLNNIFSFMKNMLARTSNGKLIIYSLLCAMGSGSLLLSFTSRDSYSAFFWISLSIISLCPCIIALAKKRFYCIPRGDSTKEISKILFLSGTIFLTMLVGLLIPSTYIAASPQEFIEVGYFYHPIWYVVHTLCLSAGTFLIWCNIF